MNLMPDELFIKLLAGGIGLLVMLAAFAVFSLAAARSNPLRRRLDELGTLAPAEAEVAHAKLGQALRPLGAYLLPKRQQERETLRLKLVRAGFRSEHAAVSLYVIQLLLILMLPAVVLFWLASSFTLHPMLLLLAGFGAAFVGMILPNVYLSRRIEGRHGEMLNALPDALDLLVACTEAGLGLNAALQRVAKQMDISSPLLAQELEQVNAEIRGGMDRIEALHNLTHRTGLNEIRGLVSLLSQSVRFGSSVADILRVYAEEFRDKRMQRAEEQAALVGTKLIFPLCFCIFPAFFVVAVGPAVVALVEAFTKF
jgi:tight adherence protein C